MPLQKCRAPQCEALVQMMKYVKPPHRPAPIEVEKAADGNIIVYGDTYEILSGDKLTEAREKGWPLFKNHFATCQFSPSFKKKKEKESPGQPNNVVKFPGR